MRTAVTPIVAFLAITYGLAVVLSLAVGLTGGHQSDLAALGLIAMFFPAIGVLILRIAKEGIPVMGWNRFSIAFLPIALFLMPATMHALMLPVTAALEGGLPWQDWLTPQPDGLYHVSEERGWGVLTTQGLIGRIAANAVVGLVIVSIFVFFEEIGWRAWLLPRLMQHMSARAAVMVSAAAWAFWHTPFVLSGIHNIDNIPVALLAILMPIGQIGAGMVIGWMWLRTQGIWMVVLAHAALNNWGQYAFKFMKSTDDYAGLVHHEVLILGAGNIGLLAVGSLMVARYLPRLPKP